MTEADLGDEGGRGVTPLRDSTPANPKGPPLVLFKKLNFDPKIFQKAPLAPTYTIFEGERAPKNAFFVKFLQKVPKNGFFDLFFHKLPSAEKIWPKKRLFSVLGELEKSIWST